MVILSKRRCFNILDLSNVGVSDIVKSIHIVLLLMPATMSRHNNARLLVFDKIEGVHT